MLENINNIPPELRDIPHWVAWQSIDRGNGKTGKVPINPITGKNASTTDPQTWSTFDEAVDCAGQGHQGIGFVFTGDDPYVGIDLDDCYDPQDGKLCPSAAKLLARFDSYTEITPSEQGLHILMKGKLPGKGMNKGKTEIYDQARFFTVTGNRLPSSPLNIEDCDAELKQFYQELSSSDMQNSPQEAILNEKQRAILDKANTADNGDKFKRLWSGDTSKFVSQSEADLALCNMIAYWSDNDPSLVDCLFRHSQLYRDKWDNVKYTDGKTYGQATVQKAVQFTPHHKSPDKINKLFKLTDLGNAERLAHIYNNDIKYCHAWKTWLIWDGLRWVTDRTETINQYAKKVIRSIGDEAEKATDSSEKKAIDKHALRSESDARVGAMIKRARSEEGIPILSEQLDSEQWMLTCHNGTLDLGSGELNNHDRNHLITKLAPVEFDPHADCPTWLSFLDRIMDGNDNLISFLQRAIGYSLTGDTSEQCLFILYGTGANGKSTFLQAISSMLGDYSMQTPTETLLVKRAGSMTNDVARLKGARFVTASESEADQRLAESLIKQLTGQDILSARFLRCEHFDFLPNCKIFLATNHKPVIQGTDNAIWRRIKLIPFDITIPEADRDKDLPTKLQAELPGIFAWAVRGCNNWQKIGLGTPDEVKAATQDYKNDMDTTAQFIEDCCTINPLATATTKQLYDAYCAWCESNGEQRISMKSLSIKIREQGFQPTQVGKSRVRGYKGIGIQADLVAR